jgi:dual specificity protein kinase YAK1
VSYEARHIEESLSIHRNPPAHILENGKQTHDFFNHTGFDAQGRKQYTLKSMEQYSREKRTAEQPSKQYFKQTKLKEIIMEYPYSKKNPKQSDIDKGE